MARLHQLYDGLFISGIPKPEDIERGEITAVVNTIKADDSPEVISQLRYYAHYAIPDGKVVKKDLLSQAADDALYFWNGHNVLIHCRAGRNRSATVAALVLFELGVVDTPKEAIDYIRSRRPRAIANPAFEAWLVEESAQIS